MVERLYSMSQVASLLGATAPMVQEWVRRGWLEAEQLPEQPIRIAESALVRFLRDRGVDLPGIVEKVMREETSAQEPGERREPAGARSGASAGSATAGAPSAVEPGASAGTAAGVPSAVESGGGPRPPARPSGASTPSAGVACGGDMSDDAGAAGRTARQVLAAILEDAARRRATAIHLEAGPQGLALSLRVDGRLHEKMNFRARLPQGLAPLILAKCKAMAGLDPAERRLPQYGNISMHVAGRETAVGLASCPTAGGERLVIRLRPCAAPALEDLGLSPAALASVRRMLAAPGGLVVVAGPTCAACGRALGALAAALEDDGRCVVAVTRTPGGTQPALRQVVAGPEGGLSAAAALRAAVGQDADAIAMDDLGDRPTLEAAIEAARAGPLVLAGLVSRRPATDPAALVAAGADRLALACVLVGMVALRTVRRICEHCKAPATPAPELLDRLSLRHDADGLPAWEGRGCQECGGTGFCGEANLYAVLPVDGEVARLIAAGADGVAIEKAGRAAGALTPADAAIEAIRSGVTTAEEAARALEVAHEM